MRDVRAYIAGCLVILESERGALSKSRNAAAVAVCEGKRQVLEGVLDYLGGDEMSRPIEILETWVVDAAEVVEIKWTPPPPLFGSSSTPGKLGSLTVRVKGQVNASTLCFDDLEAGQETARRAIAAWRESLSEGKGELR